MERETWMEAVEEQRAYSLDKLIENEPVMISELYFKEYARDLTPGLINQ